MALVNRKTRKAISKEVGKVLKKHGPQIATGIATGIMSSLLTLVGKESQAQSTADARGKKSSSRKADDEKKASSASKQKKHGGKRPKKSQRS